MTPPLDLSRRQFLTAASLTAGAALLAGCTPLTHRLAHGDPPVLAPPLRR
jgi:hypothetical protein